MAEITAAPDVTIHVDDTGGDGRPVVLIHGWPLSGKSWSEQVPALQAAGHRVITYDRRGFGDSAKPSSGYDYDTFSDDLHAVLEGLDLRDAVIVGFSMGGGEVARYPSRHGTERLRGVVFAAAVPPYLLKSDDNPDGPLTEEMATEWGKAIDDDIDGFFKQFVTMFFSVGDDLLVTDAQWDAAYALYQQADPAAIVGCMQAFGTTDFRGDLPKVDVPALVIHGDSDSIVPVEGSGQRTHEAISGSELHVVSGAPHGLNVTHAGEFNEALLGFLAK